MDKKEMCELIERFTTDDVLHPQLRKPWIVDGVVYATDGRIAIRIKEADGLDYEHVKDGDWRKKAAGDLDRWISERRDAIDRGALERIAPYMSYLRKAAYAAMDDARIYAVGHYPATTDDIEEMTVDEAVDRYSDVILLGSKRHVVAAKYAAMVCDAVDAFGSVEIYVPVNDYRRGNYDAYRIQCHGECFDILLMAIRSKDMDAQGLSVADSATGRLVHSIADDSFVAFSKLQFGHEEWGLAK